MGTRFSWAYLIRCDATDYIYPSPTKPKNQVRTTPLPNVIRQHAATTSRSSVFRSCRSMDRFTPKAAGYPTRAIRPKRLLAKYVESGCNLPLNCRTALNCHERQYSNQANAKFVPNPYVGFFGTPTAGN